MQRSHLMRYVTVFFACVMSGLALASDVQIIQLKGSVTLRSRGQLVNAKLDGTLPAPVEVRTGRDGMVSLRQLGSDLNVGPDSVVILPEVANERGAMQKIQQQSGRVLYQVERKDRQFVVETRHLVSVVKGTVFSVAAEAGGTQVSLLEGSLEVSGPGIDLPVLLKPNESATRSADGTRIEVKVAELFAPPAPVSPATTAALNAIAAPAPDVAVAVIAATGNTADAGNVARVQTDLGDLMAAISDRRTAAIVSAAPAVPTTSGAQAPTAQPEAGTPATPSQPDVPVSSPATTSPVLSRPGMSPPVVSLPLTQPGVVTQPPAIVSGTPVVTSPVVALPGITPPVVTPPVTALPVVTPPVVTLPVVSPPVITLPVVTAPVVAVPPVAVTPPVVAVPPVVVTPPVVVAPVVTPPVVVPPPVVLLPGGNDDGNNGHGNDDDGEDSSNPGHGRGNGRKKQ